VYAFKAAKDIETSSYHEVPTQMSPTIAYMPFTPNVFPMETNFGQSYPVQYVPLTTMPPSEANFIVPGKRPLSSMVPTLVFQDDQIYFVVGSSGGPKIITSTMNAIVKVLSFGMSLYDAIQTPKMHHQLIPVTLEVETGLSASIAEGLAAKGNTLVWVPPQASAVTQGILVDNVNNGMWAVSDFRKNGQPAGF